MLTYGTEGYDPEIGTEGYNLGTGTEPMSKIHTRCGYGRIHNLHSPKIYVVLLRDRAGNP